MKQVAKRARPPQAAKADVEAAIARRIPDRVWTWLVQDEWTDLRFPEDWTQLLLQARKWIERHDEASHNFPVIEDEQESENAEVQVSVEGTIKGPATTAG